MQGSKVRRLTYVTMLSALAIVINLVESYFIPPIQFGIRFGLANIIALITIELLGTKEMIIVNAMRVTIGSLLRGVIFGTTFFISFGGVLLSTIIIVIMHKIKASLWFTSMMSAIFHSLGQVLVVMFIYRQEAVIAILPLLAVSSIATGILTGFIANECVKRYKR